MKKKLLRQALKKATAIALTSAMALGIVTTVKTPLDVKAAFEAKHYDIRENGGTWDGKNYTLDGEVVKDAFFCDGTYTYFLQADGTPMTDRLTYHPDGEHVIYFDADGHEVFSNFNHVKKSIAGDPVDDLCFFDVYGYMYTNVLTFNQAGDKIYYANPYGVMECSGWFQFAAEAGGIAEALGVTEGMWGYAYANGVIEAASIGDENVKNSYVVSTELTQAAKEETEANDSRPLTFRNSNRREEHYEKHGIEMGFSSPEEYEAAARKVVLNKNALHKIEAEDGDDVYYLAATNEFVVVSPDGYIRTYFNPSDGIDYYNRQ
ncbi:MAG: hypothetical protein IJ141_03520 [Lachnospiraceae bacterium]|nr:hypothetical protein [Lachnospiraceae bacterium]